MKVFWNYAFGITLFFSGIFTTSLAKSAPDDTFSTYMGCYDVLKSSSSTQGREKAEFTFNTPHPTVIIPSSTQKNGVGTQPGLLVFNKDGSFFCEVSIGTSSLHNQKFNFESGESMTVDYEFDSNTHKYVEANESSSENKSGHKIISSDKIPLQIDLKPVAAVKGTGSSCTNISGETAPLNSEIEMQNLLLDRIKTLKKKDPNRASLLTACKGILSQSSKKSVQDFAKKIDLENSEKDPQTNNVFNREQKTIKENPKADLLK